MIDGSSWIRRALRWNQVLKRLMGGGGRLCMTEGRVRESGEPQPTCRVGPGEGEKVGVPS